MYSERNKYGQNLESFDWFDKLTTRKLMTSTHKQTPFDYAQGKNTSLKRKVIVGMSGGVDSSVSALLLKEEGYDVTGVFIRTWTPDWLECSWRDERRDAMRVAAHIGVPLLTLNLEEEYKRDVADSMIAEYKKGRTPNPDVMCNKQIKFGAFYDWAMEQGADFVATGHYARVRSADPSLAHGKQGKFAEKESPSLLQSVDTNKDQTYFLWALRHGQLSHVLFPIGALTKGEVRKIATKYKIPVADKKDSQGICFLGKVDIRDFLKHYIDVKEGDVLNNQGEIIGKHEGALLYTIGQRQGFTTNATEPMYVADRDLEHNTITATTDVERLWSAKREFRIEDVNWVSGETPDVSKTYQFGYRHRGELSDVILPVGGLTADAINVIFAKPQAIAAGQSIVIYDENICLGGGVVK